MSDRYAATGASAVTSGGKTVLSIENEASPIIRGKVFDLVIGAEGTPADVVLNWVARRASGGGTSTGVTPAPLDFDAPASNLEAGEDYSPEPVYPAGQELLDMPLNKRASFRWVASPGAEWMIPANAADGIGIVAIHASDTDTARATMHFEE